MNKNEEKILTDILSDLRQTVHDLTKMLSLLSIDLQTILKKLKEKQA